MASVRLISTSTVKAETITEPNRRIELTPWDLQILLMGSIQKGLVFHKPKPAQEENSLINHLKTSFSRTLNFFPPLAGRFSIVEHEDNTRSFYIDCNNAGAYFLHAVADGVTIADILDPIYVPSLVHSFFPLNGVKNYEGVSKPLLGVQVTELVDGIFIGFTINHAAADGTTLWNFVNSWSEISRGFSEISKPPSFTRAFPDHPIRIPLSSLNVNASVTSIVHFEDRVFHFSKDKIAKLKSRASTEIGATSISSLQALLAHVWRSVIRSRKLPADLETSLLLAIGGRSRLHQLIPQQYFGNAFQYEGTTLKAGDILECGIGYVACAVNKMITGNAEEEKLLNFLQSWVENPKLLSMEGKYTDALATSSSPRFNVYGNDFGWGKPIAARSGAANKYRGKLTLLPGAEEGSVDIEASLPLDILEAMGSDMEFMDAVSH
ncbi:hypothetical protein HS088_TW01G00808 [Tripterygium wilfordii]|uniref:HXXXD-type acyl-transferase family protein n=1 Tax=Tripterygium wilfordii TaxID=458696 RepID=A0A7J7E2M3_TRIWF|nr:uncharacterized acetyltransferase At3g50280-like [Tripterygium wilfordii]KAF5752890.1 hypothetical protein HS088_TW01G00808 [Tripterygium wilfordii]